MQVPFRQGIIKAAPNFLQIAGSTVSLVSSHANYVLIAIADGESDYLVAEKSSVASAWTGPFYSGTNYWLYWDINPLTGAKTYGHTIYEPIESSRAPLSPMGDQHWFDTSSNTMKVWNAAVGRWVRKVRLFAAKLAGTSVFVSMSINSPLFTGTQIGSYLTAAVQAGFLIFDNEGKALRKSNGTFFTTEDVGITGVASSSKVKLGSVVREAEAMANMTKNTIVVFTDFDKISPAQPHMFTQTKQFGIIEEDVVIGDFVNVITEGAITSYDWDWSPYGINAPVYVGSGGVLSLEASPLALNPVAIVIGKHTIHFGVPKVVTQTVGEHKATVNAQTGTTYTLLVSDASNIIDHANATGVTVTLPNNLVPGFRCTYVQSGAGQITFVPDTGATLHNRLLHAKTAGQWASVTIFVRSNTTGTNAEYVLVGDTAP